MTEAPEIPHVNGSRIVAPIEPDEGVPAQRAPADTPPGVWRGPQTTKGVTSSDTLAADDDQADDDKPVPVDADPRLTPSPLPWSVPGERRPVVPAWVLDSAQRRAAAAWAARWTGHATLFHLVRLPKYAARTAYYSPRGAIRAAVRWFRWMFDWDAHALRLDLIQRREAGAYHTAARHRDDRVKNRAIGSLAALAGAALGSVAAWSFWSPAPLLELAAGLAALVWHGRPVGAPFIVDRTVTPTTVARLTSDIVARALGALGNSDLRKAVDRRELAFTAPIVRDGPGWRAELDLPPGVTAVDVIEKRAELSSGLRRPLGCVWPEPADEEHSGHLVLWVGDRTLARTTQPAWPLLNTGSTSMFRPLPFGVDQRGRAQCITLMFAAAAVGAQPRMGKALALDTPVPTPSGWTTMGELQAGDQVFDENGQPATVTDAWPVQYDRPCYEVEFSDGSVIVADAEHLWQVETRASRTSESMARARPARRDSPLSRDQRHKRATAQVLTTQEMTGSLRVNPKWGGGANYSVRVAAPLNTPDAELPVGPYTLGAWLGDGTGVTGVITNPEPEVIAEVVGEGEQAHRLPSSEGKCPQWRVDGLTARLKSLGVLGDKHIPASYLRASEQQRRALLAGLLDTDGYCQKFGTVEFAVTCERLARDVRHLVSTLGYKCTLTSKPARLNGKDCGTAWIVRFTPADKVFRLPRKAARQVTRVRPSAGHRYITAIRPTASVPVRCITVDSPNSLYLVGESCIPTHNTFAVRLLALAAALDPSCELHLYDGKGMGDWVMFEPVAHWFGSGSREDVLLSLLADLEALKVEVDRRAELLTKLTRAGKCREGKVTEELAKVKSYGLHPILVLLDECHLAFDTGKGKAGELGAQITRLAEYLVRVGPAAGVSLIASTQRPDAESLPSGIRANVQIRFCLRVADQGTNDMVLGTSAYKNGIRATEFGRRDLGIGYLAGEGDAPVILRTYYVDADKATAVVARARQAREAAGTITGMAAGIAPARKSDPGELLADVLAALGEDEQAWSSAICERLADAHPGRYSGWDAEALGKALRALGVTTGQTWWTPATGKPGNRNGVKREQITARLREVRADQAGKASS